MKELRYENILEEQQNVRETLLTIAQGDRYGKQLRLLAWLLCDVQDPVAFLRSPHYFTAAMPPFLGNALVQYSSTLLHILHPAEPRRRQVSVSSLRNK
jgi:hypothetical protein